ncbi:hypothetical protein PHYPSEUDO_002723 [Phytophthora pseudosyringae]|uniref:Uncharacterized protein n=1 Tax=Phytophthora pseudosyringae TaxID=221518 RepID=A0A8T1WI40_9STRA|nr:hypothetical protein PHYPSEUDO_002723 [Phytophthora pseudosyringae]
MQSDLDDEAGCSETRNRPATTNENMLQPSKRKLGESSLKIEHIQRLRNIETWNAQCIAEEKGFEQQASRFEYDFSKALQSTDHLGVPNALRTATCFDVLTKISTKFPRFENLTRMTRSELERSAYINDRSPTLVVKSDPFALASAGGFAPEALKESLARRAYFTELKEVLKEKESLEQRLSRLDSLHQFMLKRLRNNELMVDRLAYRWGRLVMRQTLADWKKIIIRKKYTRVLLEKTRWRWAKQRLMRLFHRWNDYAVAEKVRKSNEQIQLYRDNKHDFQELIGRLQVQIEGAKVELKAHREHLDLAKRHTMSLEELLAQLELRVRHSQERKLQTISNQWGKLCFAFVDCECDYLQNMLDSVSVEDYVDVSALLMKGEDDSDLLRLPSELLVLRWINFQLEQCGEAFRHFFPSSVGLIQNFSSDMHCYYPLRHILQRVLTVKRRRQPARPAKMQSTFNLLSRAAVDSIAGANASSKQSPFPTREELYAALTEQLNPPCPALLCDHVLSNEMPSDLMFCLFSFLVCEHPSLAAQSSPTGQGSNPASAYPWYEAQVALNEARAVWESVRLQWRELQTPFDVLEATKAPPEMTSPPQLLAKANIVLQNAVNTVQYACSKRGIAVRVWGCLQRRMQQDALRLLVRRGREQTPFELVDRRVWREKYMLTTLHISKLAQVSLTQSDNKQSNEEVTEELQRVEQVLGEHYERLRQVYLFYANVDSSRTPRDVASENQPRGGGNAVDEARFFHKLSACMSLGEFYVFLKECQVFGKTRSFPYDFVQNVFDKVSPDVAASMETATLMLPLTHTLSAPSKDPGREMTPAEFVEALVHIVPSARVQWKGADVVPSTGLAQCFQRFLEEIVFPTAMSLDEEKSSVFRPQLLTFECREVFTTHHKKLRSMYSHFAASEMTLERRFANQDSAELRGSSKMLSANGFVNCCQHYDLFRENLLHFDDIQHILAETLHLERESVHFDLAGATTGSASSFSDVPETRTSKHKSKPGQSEENVLLTLAEFLEALAAVACYLTPDAFVPLAAKLDAFFSERLESSAIAS